MNKLHIFLYILIGLLLASSVTAHSYVPDWYITGDNPQYYGQDALDGWGFSDGNSPAWLSAPLVVGGNGSIDLGGTAYLYNNTFTDFPATNCFALDIWFNITDWADTDQLFSIGNASNDKVIDVFLGGGDGGCHISPYGLYQPGVLECVDNSLQHLTYFMNGSHIGMYRNGVQIGATAYTGGIADMSVIYLGCGTRYTCNTYSPDTKIANVAFFDECLSPSDIEYNYNSGAGVVFPTVAGSDPTPGVDVIINSPAANLITNVSDLTIDYYVNSSNSSLDECYYFVNGVLTTTNTTPQNDTNNYFYDNLADGNYNLSVNCTDVSGYSDIENILNITIDTTYPSQVNDFGPYYTYQQIVNINFTDTYGIRNVSIIDDCNISYINTTIGRQLYNYTYTSQVSNCSLGSYSTTLNYCDYAGNCNQDVYNWANQARLNITVRYARDNSTILNYSISVDDILQGNTTSGSYLLDNLTGNINVSVNAPGFALGSALFNITKTLDVLNFTLYGTNSLLIYIYDEKTDALVTQNITLDFSGTDGSSWTNISTGGELYLEDINATEYTIQFYNDIYALRTYIVTVGDRTSQTLNAYMINNTYDTIFTVIDKDTDAVIDGVSFGVYRQKAGIWSLISNPVTDITGKVKFYYDPVANYRFYLNKPGYDDLIFYLNPIIFSSYDVQMEVSTLLNYTFNLDDIAIVYGPQSFNNTQVTNFTFLINSPYGSLTEYGINLTYPGGSNYITGSNAIGGALTALINISNATVFDVVRLEYFYTTTIGGRRNFTDQFPIDFPDGTGSLTFVANRNKTFGLGIFERVLVATLIAIFIVGIAALVGQPLPGFGLNLFIQSYLTYIGFIPIWITLPSLLLGMMILIWKSGGT